MNETLREKLLNSIQEKPFLVNTEVAKIFRCSKSTVNRWIDEGKLRSIQPGKKHLILKESVLELLQEYQEHIIF